MYKFSAENETRAENVILFSAVTETKTKLVDHFRPKTKPKTKVIIFIDCSVILYQHQQWFFYDDLIVDVIISLYSTISCSTSIATSSLQKLKDRLLKVAATV